MNWVGFLRSDVVSNTPLFNRLHSLYARNLGRQFFGKLQILILIASLFRKGTYDSKNNQKIALDKPVLQAKRQIFVAFHIPLLGCFLVFVAFFDGMRLLNRQGRKW
ncbi:hypothetical protein EBT16_00400 [bacterium]|nr:hypothetical protein [bacterium]